MKALLVFGARPEAVTMAPIIEVMVPRGDHFDLRICVTAQADAATPVTAAMAGYWRHVRVGHVEAGLRMYDKPQPFPQVPLRSHFNRPARVAKRLTGAKTKRIVAKTESLLKGSAVYEQMANALNPYGDGLAADRICKSLTATTCEKAACKC